MSWKFIIANMNNLKIFTVVTFILTLFFAGQKVQAQTCNIECLRYDPVCGIDGKTYGCGLPESECYDVKIAYTGACKTDACALSDPKSKKLCATLIEKEAFEKYLKNNISKLSPQKAVLGGTFYITKIVWQPNRVALVYYEDGHIALAAITKISVAYKKGLINWVKANYFKILKLN